MTSLNDGKTNDGGANGLQEVRIFQPVGEWAQHASSTNSVHEYPMKDKLFACWTFDLGNTILIQTSPGTSCKPQFSVNTKLPVKAFFQIGSIPVQ